MINKVRIFIHILFFIPLIACAGIFGRKAPRIDQGMKSIYAGDRTALIEGCGNQLVPGYTYCRKMEGEASGENLYFVGPVTNCKREHCVEFKIFFPDGSPAYGDTIPKKEFRKAIPWSKIIKRETFEVGDRGFWPFTYWIYWLDSNGRENVTVSEGEIRLRVLKKEYLPLHEVVNDGNFTWIFRTKSGETVKMTTGGRTYVSPR